MFHFSHSLSSTLPCMQVVFAFTSWYFGAIRRSEAENFLLIEENRDGAFLIRDSESRSEEYSLSGKWSHCILAKSRNAHQNHGVFVCSACLWWNKTLSRENADERKRRQPSLLYLSSNTIPFVARVGGTLQLQRRRPLHNSYSTMCPGDLSSIIITGTVKVKFLYDNAVWGTSYVNTVVRHSRWLGNTSEFIEIRTSTGTGSVWESSSGTLERLRARRYQESQARSQIILTCSILNFTIIK